MKWKDDLVLKMVCDRRVEERSFLYNKSSFAFWLMEGKRWTVRDRFGYEIYLTEERWEHIIDPENHPEMEAYEDELIETLRSSGTRTQAPLNPQKYRYSKAFANLIVGNTHTVAIVLCRFKQGSDGQPVPNNYIVTAYQKLMK